MNFTNTTTIEDRQIGYAQRDADDGYDMIGNMSNLLAIIGRLDKELDKQFENVEILENNIKDYRKIIEALEAHIDALESAVPQ